MAPDAQPAVLTATLGATLSDRRRPETPLTRIAREEFEAAETLHLRAELDGPVVKLPPLPRPGNPVVSALRDCIAGHIVEDYTRDSEVSFLWDGQSNG